MGQEFSFSKPQQPQHAFLTSGLRGTEMWGGGFSTGNELFGQIFISGGHQKNKTTASGSYMHVSSIKDEGNCTLNSGETLYLHGQLCPAWRAAGNWILQTWVLHNTYVDSQAYMTSIEERSEDQHRAHSPSALLVLCLWSFKLKHHRIEIEELK